MNRATFLCNSSLLLASFILMISMGNAITKKPSEFPRAFIDGRAQGWRELTQKDFVIVNSAPGTWTWKNGLLHCAGNPTGDLRTQKMYTNFECLVSWRHLKSAGNSGIFVWVPEESIKDLKSGSIPDGIEMQVLDPGADEQYQKQTGKKGDWFTTQGDIIATGKSKMKPFLPMSPDGTRSFPRKNLTRRSPAWNHYYFRCINGEARLWVNGEEVSGASECEPRTGYLCFESQRSPVDFANIRVRELP